MAQRSRAIPLLLLVLPLAQTIHAQAPTRLLACESPGSACTRPDARLDTVWTFDGTQGTATSPSRPSPSSLSIEKFDSDALVVRRSDESGLTALYSGAVHGTHIAGTVQYVWPGHPGYPSAGTFAAILQDSIAAAPPPDAAPAAQAGTLPGELLVCENSSGCNGAWTIRGATGTATWFARTPSRATLTVVRSAPDDILIRRTDLNDGISAVYAGRLRGDHFSGTIIYSSPGHPGDSTGTWTATIPQTTCDPNAGLDPDQAMTLGQNALMFRRDRDALNCYIVAARAGDSKAQTAVGLIFYQGKGNIEQDYKQAFFWLHKAADQGIYPAQRTVAEMYAAGQGTAPNLTLSHIYTARADEQQHNQERREESAERAADRRAQIISSFVMGASFGLFF